MTGSRILVECLVEQGVATIFGYPGGSVITIYDELGRNEDRIAHILTSHEQGAAHAADGYARSTGKVGVCLATSGPGATNLVTGIATAYMDSIPIIAITGNAPVPLLGKDSFQEVDIVGITKPVTKGGFIVKDVALLAETLRVAFALARSGRPGPVLVDIPKDVAAASAEWRPDTPGAMAARLRKIELGTTWHPSGELLDKAASLIALSKLPVIYAGGGIIASGASGVLREFAERIKAPVAVSFMGTGCIPARHPLCMGMVGMHGSKASNMAITRADLVIAAGARFSDRVIGDPGHFARNATIIHLDIDPTEIDKNVHAHLSVIGDVGESLRGLLGRVEERRESEWTHRLEEWKKDRAPLRAFDRKGLSPRFVMEEAAARAGEEAFVATDVGQHQMWTAQFWPFTGPRRFASSGGLGTMGFGLGAAMGMQLGNPEARVVLVTGDGSFRMNMNELATVANYGLPIIILLMNNGTLGMVRQWQTMFYQRRYSQTSLDRGPDFQKLAAAFGIESWKAEDEKGLCAALDAAFARRAPALIEVKIDIDETVLPMVPAGKPIADQIIEA